MTPVAQLIGQLRWGRRFPRTVISCLGSCLCAASDLWSAFTHAHSRVGRCFLTAAAVAASYVETTPTDAELRLFVVNACGGLPGERCSLFGILQDRLAGQM